MTSCLLVTFLLPLKYNNGANVGQEKFFRVKEEIVGKFGGISINPISMEGAWVDEINEITCYEDCKRFEVCMENTRKNYGWLLNYKKRLKKEFKQKEIYMIAIEAERI